MKKTGQRSSILFLVIGIVFILISLGLSVFLLKKNHEYDVQIDIVEDVRDQVVIPPDDVLVNADSEFAVVDESGNYVELTYIDANLLRRVDFDALSEINPDATRWLYIPDTPIDSYVMQEQTVGKYYYLWRDIHKRSNSSGSLLTPKLPLDGDDPHLIIFGHRIFGYDAVGFGSLRVNFSDAAAASAYPYVYVYYPDRAERWAVWTACDIYEYDKVYEYPYVLGSSQYEELLRHISEESRFENFETPDAWTNTLFLSTCNGRRGGSNVRFLVGCVPDMTYYYETATLESFEAVHVGGDQVGD